MRTLTSLKDQPVYDLYSGNVLGHICDLCISVQGIVQSILFKKRSFLSKKCLLPIEAILSFGKDGVMSKKEAIIEAKAPESDFTFFQKPSLFGKLTLNEEGEVLGRLEDVYFLDHLGTIVAYKVTDGFFSDLTEGKKIFHSVCPPTIGEDAIIVALDRIRGGQNVQMSKLQ